MRGSTSCRMPRCRGRGDGFVLRQSCPPITIAGGVVLDPSPARTPIRTPSAAERFERLSRSDREAAMVFIEERRSAGIAIDALARRAGLSPQAARALAGPLAGEGQVIA